MYDSGIRFTDDWFAGFRSLIEAEGVWNQAVIALISDHGEAFQEHQAIFHEKIYARISRIPMIIRLPEARGAGVFHPVVESIDLIPTLLEAVAANAPCVVQGQRLLPLTEGRSAAKHLDDIAVTESPYRGRRLALATAQHRLLLTRSTGQAELYRYRQDPLDQKDISA